MPIIKIYYSRTVLFRSKTFQFYINSLYQFSTYIFLHLLLLQQQYIGNSMSGKQKSLKQTQRASDVSNDEVSSSSDFSVSKSKKSFRKVNKKKITKIIHTYCFINTAADGKKELFFCQQAGDSSLKNPALVKSLALKQLRQQTGRMIQLAKKNTGFTKAQIIEPILKQENYVQPSQLHFGEFPPFYFIYS